MNVAVCLLPGTELSFAHKVGRAGRWPWSKIVINHKTAIFRQINQEKRAAHHDALEFPDGQIVLLTCLKQVSRPQFFSCRPRLLTLKPRNEQRMVQPLSDPRLKGKKSRLACRVANPVGTEGGFI